MKTRRSKHRKKTYAPKGGLSAGMSYVILAILVIVAGGSLMTGSVLPLSSVAPTSAQPVITLPPQNKPGKDNLQLYTFPAVTYTPTPSPTPLPTPTRPILPTSKFSPPPATPTGSSSKPTTVPTTPKPTSIPPGKAL